MATIKRPTIDDAMKLVYAYGTGKGATENDRASDARVCELARAYVALLQTVEAQAERLKTACERLNEWPKDK